MVCRDCFEIPPYTYGIGDSINTQIMNSPKDILFFLLALKNDRKLDIVKLKK